MEIRTAGPDSADDVLALLDAAVRWLAARGRTGQWGEQPWSTRPGAAERIRGYARDHLLRIAEDEHGRTVGACVLTTDAPDGVPPADRPELYIRWLVTDREHRGLGAVLVADALDRARERGRHLLRVDCYAGDDGALVTQYERLGFTRTISFTEDRAAGPWPCQVLELPL
ncbi:GNAT family N-acetyltransferase [Kitasatospora sp. NPDC048365]|uniref:GNAT family N-acetyltransferase n=1 Tax=Kitasatospora sp. NPDC048365 TaxID=3364050 RepID=UPI00371B99FE